MQKDSEIIKFIRQNNFVSSKEIHDGLNQSIGYSTLKRYLNQLVDDKRLEKQGNGNASKYGISSVCELFEEIDIDEYFKLEVDERKIKNAFNFDLITVTLSHIGLFTNDELQQLIELQSKFMQKIAKLNSIEYQKEMERLAIDLSWKSSQIEGNTYTLLETERLLKEKLTADGKTKDEAIMLLNHKDALDFILENTDYLNPIQVNKIEDIHSILVKELNVNRNIRTGIVGITGTNYKPLDNEHQIREAMYDTCKLINKRDDVFEKALLALLLLSYIQPFSDGNKRTARIVSNALLLSQGYCPLSFRTIDAIEYKKAMLLFYEQNNITAFKKIFISQYDFAVNTYF